MNVLELASDQLRRAADLVEQIEELKKELSATIASSTSARGRRKERKLSDAGRLTIAAAQRAKSKVKSTAKPIPKKPGKRTMSAAAKAKIAAAAKARWAKAKAAGRRSL